MIKTAGLLALFCSMLSGCNSTPERGYEVLKVPVPLDGYRVGSQWKVGVGPIESTEPGAEVEQVVGMNSWSTTREDVVGGQLTGALTAYVATTFGLRANTDFSLELKNMNHHFVKDAGKIGENGTFLWDTIAVDSIDFTLIGSAFSREQLTEKWNRTASASSLTLQPSDSTKGLYKISASGKPIVVAIRVVNIEWSSAKDFIITTVDSGLPHL
jgi:hypothetical protein